MQHTETTSPDTAAGMIRSTGSTAAWRVMDVRAQPGFCLQVTFVDGTAGTVELSRFLASSAVQGTAFEPLRDEGFFRCASIERGAVHWPSGADLAPDAMYDAIKSTGRWIVDSDVPAEGQAHVPGRSGR